MWDNTPWFRFLLFLLWTHRRGHGFVATALNFIMMFPGLREEEKKSGTIARIRAGQFGSRPFLVRRQRFEPGLFLFPFVRFFGVSFLYLFNDIWMAAAKFCAGKHPRFTELQMNRDQQLIQKGRMESEKESEWESSNILRQWTSPNLWGLRNSLFTN